MNKSPAIPSPEFFCLPAQYQQQRSIESHDEFNTDPYWNAERIATSAMYQQHVYRWAASLISKLSVSSVLDIGCGPGTKLAKFIQPYCNDVVGADLENAVVIAQRLHEQIRFQVADLDQYDTLGDRNFDLIICADVIEHLADPRILLKNIRSVCHSDSKILISTPDRHRLRGRQSMGSPMKEHIREWSVHELNQFLQQEGFEILKSRLFHFGDGNHIFSSIRDFAYRLRLTGCSPLRCNTVLCTPK